MAIDRFHEFLMNDYFEELPWKPRHDTHVLKEMTPHEIYGLKKGDLSKSIRGVGPKGEAVILQLIEEYKPHDMFCSCGEPRLDWYKFCPMCGEEA